MRWMRVTLVVGVGLAVACAAAGAYGDKQPASRTAQSPAIAASDRNVGAHFEYVGTKKCRMCHGPLYRSWLDSPKGGSFDGLRPGVRAQAKRRAGLAVDKDFTTDQRCLACHAVGLGQPGGYQIPSDEDRRSKRKAKAREGVGCESCHGPGSGFVEVMRDIRENRRSYDPAELQAKGRRPVTQQVCNSCHNSRAICMIPIGTDPSRLDAPWMHVDVSDRGGYHEPQPLKYRRETSKRRNAETSRNPSP